MRVSLACESCETAFGAPRICQYCENGFVQNNAYEREYRRIEAYANGELR